MARQRPGYRTLVNMFQKLQMNAENANTIM